MDPDENMYILIVFLILLFFLFTVLKKAYEKYRNEDVSSWDIPDEKRNKIKKLISHKKGLFFFFNIIETVLIVSILSLSIISLDIYSIVVVFLIFAFKSAIQLLGKKYAKNILLSSATFVYTIYKPFMRWHTPQSEQTEINRKFLENIAKLAMEQKVLDINEHTMINNILYFKDKMVKDVMRTPRIHIKAISIAASYEEVLKTIQESKFSRYPVYKDNIDNIVGILYVKDFISFNKHEIGQFRVDRIMKQFEDVIYIMDSKNVSELFYEMKKRRIHIAIVIDEYGGTIGLITLEDILEMIVGDICDEKDENEEKFIVEKTEQHMIVHAKIPLTLLNQHFYTELEHDEVDTLGGFIINHLGRIPEKGEEFQFEDVNVSILSSEKMRVCLVKLTRKQKGEEEID